MQPQNGRERTELDPPGGQLVVLAAEHVAADVVAPPAVTDVRGGRGEVRLEVQGCPRHQRITGETDRIAVAARSCVPGERQGPLAVSGIVKEVEVVEHPQWID